MDDIQSSFTLFIIVYQQIGVIETYDDFKAVLFIALVLLFVDKRMITEVN